MIALIIIGAVAALIVIMLLLSVTVVVDYEKELSYKVSYACFDFYVNPESEKSKRKRKKREEKQKKKEQKKQDKNRRKLAKTQKKGNKSQPPQPAAEKPPEAKPSSDASPQKQASPKKEKKKLDIDLLKRIVTNSSPHAKKIFKKIRVYDVFIDIVVGGDDAAKVALNYGKTNMLVNGFLCFLDSVILLKVGEVNIEADFDKEKSDYFAHCKIKLRLCTLLNSGIRGFLAVYKELNRTSSPAPAKTTKAA